MYVCAICSEHFTRKYSANRHNTNIHGGISEIVPYIDYMAGRNSGLYLATRPSWYQKKQSSFPSNPNYQNNLGSGAVADIGDSFLHNFQQSPSSLPYASSYPSTPTIQQRAKLDELKLLLAKYVPPQVMIMILECANIRLRKGDERFLNQKLQELRIRDGSLGWRV